MSNYLYEQEFHLNLDRECQKVVDGLYAIFNKLKHYEESCKFELPFHVQKLKQNIFYMLQNYEETRP